MEGSTFTWKINNFSRLTKEFLHSDKHVIGGHRWYIIVRPKEKTGSHLGLFLGVADSESLPSGWSIFAKFSLVVVNQTADALSVRKFEDCPGSTFIWKIKNFSTQNAVSLRSDTYVIDGHRWRLEVSRKSNNGSDLRLYLAVANSASLAPGWSISAKFSLSVINQVDDTNSLEEDFESIKFCDLVKRCGWKGFVPMSELCDSTAGFLVHDALIIEARVVVEPGSPIAVKSQILVEPNSPVALKSHTAIQDFDSLFDDISKVVEESSSSLVSTGEADSCPEAVEVAHSLSLLNHLADKSFSRIPSRLLAGSTSALKILAQASTLPSAQASAIPNFCDQFEELYQSYVSNYALLETSTQFFSSKRDTFLLLKTCSKSQMRIKNSIHGMSKEAEQLNRRLRELEETKSRLFEDYAAVGKKAERAKVEWDEFIAKAEAMSVQKEKAEKEISAIETKWTSFISLFKPEGIKGKADWEEAAANKSKWATFISLFKPGGYRDKRKRDELIAKDEGMVEEKEEAENEVAAKKTKWTCFTSLFMPEEDSDDTDGDELLSDDADMIEEEQEAENEAATKYGSWMISLFQG